MPCGNKTPNVQENYILTNTVRRNLKDIARVVSLSDFAILLQGETSVGKTSMVTYLAEATGNTCIRVNNHEHTDVQEYLGSYVVDEKGAFVFQEGVLPLAMRNGFWIILDELNLGKEWIFMKYFWVSNILCNNLFFFKIYFSSN